MVSSHFNLGNIIMGVLDTESIINYDLSYPKDFKHHYVKQKQSEQQ